MPALANELVKLVAQRAKIGDLAVDFGEVDASDTVNRIAGLGLVIRQREELAHGFERLFPGVADAARRLHTRIDIDWQELL